MLFYSLPEAALLVALAIAIDWLVGDPKWPTHPVIRIGRLVKRLEARLMPQPNELASGALIRRGAVLAAVTVLAAGAAMAAIVLLAAWIHPWFGFAMHAWFISSTIAVKGL